SFGPSVARATPPGATPAAGVAAGWIQALKNGYGFIVPDQGGPNMFFFHEDVIGADFLDLKVGDRVEYSLGQNDRGACAKEVRRLGATPAECLGEPKACQTEGFRVRGLHFDCFSGLSGDMTLAALIDAGVDAEVVRQGIASLGLPIRLDVAKVRKGGFAATQVTIDAPEEHVHRH